MKIKKVVALFYNQERNGKNAREHNFLNFNFFGARLTAHTAVLRHSRIEADTFVA
jgi:hypothetical protein